MQINGITQQVIGCVYQVSNTLGTGFLEKVYENALAHELSKAGLQVDQKWQIQVRYDGVIVGHYVADLLVERQVLHELKAVKLLEDIHVAQCLNYLCATGLPVCLLVNFFRPHVEIRRLIPHHSWSQR